ncbi:MAG: IreB family regulatory phosphoprotein [Clostridia bacterium]|nr:IreB family regulatory phosphoprotein [Clostridia bacterium]
MDRFNETQQFDRVKEEYTAKDILLTVYSSMRAKGYDPVNQIVGYLLSGDPTYITSYNNSRYLISRMERDELLEELVRFYLEENK